MLFALIAGTVCLAAWLYLLLAHGRFWMVRTATIPPSSSPRCRIAVVIPARNEADVIARAITSLLVQNAPCELHIFVVDDNSSDRTTEIARSAASAYPERVTVIAGAPLPPGWSGKLWALHQGIAQALPLAPDFLLLTDADIEHAPHNLTELVMMADTGRYDMVSYMVKLHCRSLAEKLLIPAFVFFFFMLYPPRWTRDPRRRTAGAAGGCILIRPSALERIGGLPSIRQQIIDDCALARQVKRSGGRIWLGATAHTRSLRPYDSFGAIERMIARTAFNQLRHSALLLTATTLGLLLLYVLPIALLASRSWPLLAVGAAAYLLMTIAYLPMVRFYRLNPLWALTLPLTALSYTAATIHSALNYWRGRGGQWKSRTQDAARS